MLLLTLISVPLISQAQSPAPKSKQLRIGIIGSGDNNIDAPAQGLSTGAWKWVAERYGYYTSAQFPNGSNWFGNGLNRQEADSMKKWNPNMKITKYDLHARQAFDIANYVPSDSMNIIRYAQATGVPLESLLIVANGQVVINNRACPGYTYCGNATTNAGGILKFINYASNQQRMMFDPRSKRYGYYLAHVYDSICTALNIDGIFGDEYGVVGYSGIPNCDECTMSTMWPLRESNYWVSGWDNFKKPFGVSQANFYNGRDSLRKWDTLNWFKAMTDSLVNVRGRIYFMNTSANGGSIPGYWNQWTTEIAPMVRLAKATAQGEYTYQYPGDGNYYSNCRVFMQQMVATRDFARQMGYMWIRVGQYDQTQQGHSLDRSQMTALGFMLDISVLNKSTINPYGRTDLFFLPCLKNGQTDFYWNYARDISGVVLQDTTALWSYAWGKYFGDPSGVIDTSQTGTDGSSQAYRIDKAIFLKPGTTDTLTLSIGRIGRGTSSYDTSGTGVNVTLPGSASVNWYPLRSRSHAVKWDAPLPGGTVIKIGNAHFQIFSRDTVLANNGPADTTISIGDASVTEGGTANVTVALSKVLATNLTFRASTASGTATSGTDFTAISNQLYTIAAGQLSTTIPVVTTQDATVEANETFAVTISSQSLGTISRATGAGTILNDDSAPTTDSIYISNASVPEGGTASVLVTVSRAQSSNLTFRASTASGTATSGTDFTAISNQTYTITAGQLTTTVPVVTLPDAIADANETFTVTISNASIGTISRATGTVTIVDDTVPPAKTIDLGCTPGSAPGQLILTWHAPGGNGNTGRAAGYQIGFSVDSITTATWGTVSVTKLNNPVTPGAVGSAQSFTLNSTHGLVAGTKYWVALKAYDSANNYSPVSNVPSAVATPQVVATDTIPPATISSVSCVAGTNPAQLVVTWAAPGGNGNTGKVAGYEVGYARDSITESIWPTAAVHQVGDLVVPVSAGGTQQLVLTASNGLLEGVKYWLGVKAFDSAGNYTPLSNVSSATTKTTISTGGEVCFAETVSPPIGGQVAVSHPTMTVQNTTCAVPGPHTYFFEVARDSGFTQVVAQSTNVTEGQQVTSWMPADRLSAAQYYWHVRVDDQEFGETSYFTVKPETFAYPNPFSISLAGQVTFADVPQGSNLLITSVSGEVIKRWTNLPAGDVTWTGQNESGNRVAPGTYMWYLEDSATRGKIVVLP